MLDFLPKIELIPFLSWLTTILGLAALFTIIRGVLLIRSAGKLQFFRRRRDTRLQGWRSILSGFVFGIIAIALLVVGEPVLVSVYPITQTFTLTPSVTLTPSITLTPSQTLTPSITNTPAESYTPSITPTPFVPLAIQAQFESVVTPTGNEAFSPFEFARDLDSLYRPVSPGTEFQNPISAIYAVFSYDQMTDGVQWTAVWLKDGELIYYETLVWDGGTGGLGYTEWQPEPDEWLPGVYQVQLYIGLEIKVIGEFVVLGAPPSITPTPSNTFTPTSTFTSTPTRTPFPTSTFTPTRTPWPTGTPLPTITPRPTLQFTWTPTP